MCNGHRKAPRLPRGRSFVFSLGLITEALARGRVWRVCSSPDSPLVSEDERLGSCPREGFLALLRAAVSLLGELRRNGVPCPLVGAQQIHRDATLRAHCVPGHTRAAWTASPHFFFFFFLCPLRLPVHPASFKILSQGFPAPLLPPLPQRP